MAGVGPGTGEIERKVLDGSNVIVFFRRFSRHASETIATSASRGLIDLATSSAGL
jgi:hypothetical protein